MDIVLIFNGLGNQMSQYAFYLAKKKRNPKTKFLHYPDWGTYQHNGYELDKIFGIRKQNGEKTVMLTSKEVERMFNVSKRCGAKYGTRYPLCCQAMDYASKRYKSNYISGSCPGATYTLEYNLSIF